ARHGARHRRHRDRRRHRQAAQPEQQPVRVDGGVLDALARKARARDGGVTKKRLLGSAALVAAGCAAAAVLVVEARIAPLEPASELRGLGACAPVAILLAAGLVDFVQVLAKLRQEARIREADDLAQAAAGVRLKAALGDVSPLSESVDLPTKRSGR